MLYQCCNMMHWTNPFVWCEVFIPIILKEAVGVVDRVKVLSNCRIIHQQSPAHRLRPVSMKHHVCTRKEVEL